MDISFHQWAERVVNHPVTTELWDSFERLGDDGHPKVAPTIPCAGMSGVQVTFIFDFEHFRFEGV